MPVPVPVPVPYTRSRWIWKLTSRLEHTRCVDSMYLLVNASAGFEHNQWCERRKIPARSFVGLQAMSHRHRSSTTPVAITKHDGAVYNQMIDGGSLQVRKRDPQ